VEGEKMITVLAGGVGAARFLQGLVEVVPAEDITVIVNTGDDAEFFGLHVSPDIDTIMYTLATTVDEKRGWGVRGDTFSCLKMLKRYGYETWFNIGDKDLATHIYRTQLLRKGLTLSETTERIRRKLGINVKILPITDDKYVTKVVTPSGSIHFQNYFVKRKFRGKVIDVKFEGADNAKPSPKVIESILDSDAVIISPSNPIVSIGTILSVTGVKEALKERRTKIVAVSPIVGGRPIKGPADKLMQGVGLEVSAYGVAAFYHDFLGTFIIDRVDETEKVRIEGLGINVIVTNTIMREMEDKIQLAKVVLRSVGIR
jgi:LPPG:FO 2-phospho-L-lactate transferase